MPGKIQWIRHQGTDILFNDRNGLKGDDIIANVRESVELIKTCGKKDILYLVDNSNTIIIPEVKDYIKAAAKEIDPYLKKTAVIGASRAQQVLLNILNALTKMSIKPFDDIDRAQEWLIKNKN